MKSLQLLITIFSLLGTCTSEYAMMTRIVRITPLLHRLSIKQNSRPLTLSSAISDPDFANSDSLYQALRAGRKIHMEGPEDWPRFTALHVITQKEWPNTVTIADDLLRIFKANPNARDFHGATPLHWATSKKNANLDLIRTLVKYGANVNAHDAFEECPLHYAVRNSETVDVIKVLIKYNACVDALNCSHETPLFEAAEKNKPELVTLLLQNKADQSIRNYKGNTPLHVAVLNKSFEAVYALGNQEAFTHNGAGNTPIDIANKWWWGHRDEIDMRMLKILTASPRCRKFKYYAMLAGDLLKANSTR